ncbi:DEAD/DEAH box helicase, partial [Streptomyces pilosus]
PGAGAPGRGAANARERAGGMPAADLPVPFDGGPGHDGPEDSVFPPPSPGDYVSPRDRAAQAPPPWQNGGGPSYDPFAGRRTGPDRSGRAVVLAAADPANAYGAALGWPEPPPGAGHKPGRKAGSLVVLVDGELTLYMERGGKTLLVWPAADAGEPSDDPRLPAAAEALAGAARAGALGTVTVERINGSPALTSPLGALLENAGFVATPRGLRLRA